MTDFPKASLEHGRIGVDLMLSRRRLLGRGLALTALSGSVLAGLGACSAESGGNTPPAAKPESGGNGGEGKAKADGTLAWAVNGAWRTPEDKARDEWRHPEETLGFFGITSGMTVIDVWPGAGWLTQILAPYLAKGQGKYVAAQFQTGLNPDPAAEAIMTRFKGVFDANQKLYGKIDYSAFGPTSGPLYPAGMADCVLFMRTLNEWMAAGIAEKAFADAFAALKPGGILGIEQHRADAGQVQDPAATNGYVQEGFVKQLAAESGFTFVDSSEINANARDTKDHPFGVWTLPPQRLSAPRGKPDNPSFDHSAYDMIGESDRMTLKFRKPA